MADNDPLSVFLLQIFGFWYHVALFPLLGLGLDQADMLACFVRLLRALEDSPPPGLGAARAKSAVQDIADAGWSIKNIMLDSMDKAETLLRLARPSSTTLAGRLVEIAIVVSKHVAQVQAGMSGSVAPASGSTTSSTASVTFAPSTTPSPPPSYFARTPVPPLSSLTASALTASFPPPPPYPAFPQNRLNILDAASMPSSRSVVSQPIPPWYRGANTSSSSNIISGAPPIPPVPASMYAARSAVQTGLANATAAKAAQTAKAAETAKAVAAAAAALTDLPDEYCSGAFDSASLTTEQLFELVRHIVPADAFAYTRPIADGAMPVIVCAAVGWALGSKGLLVSAELRRGLTYGQVVRVLVLSGKTLWAEAAVSPAAGPAVGPAASPASGLLPSPDNKTNTNTATNTTSLLSSALTNIAPNLNTSNMFPTTYVRHLNSLYNNSNIARQRPNVHRQAPYQFPPGSRHESGSNGRPKWMTTYEDEEKEEKEYKKKTGRRAAATKTVSLWRSRLPEVPQARVSLSRGRPAVKTPRGRRGRSTRSMRSNNSQTATGSSSDSSSSSDSTSDSTSDNASDSASDSEDDKKKSSKGHDHCKDMAKKMKKTKKAKKAKKNTHRSWDADSDSSDSDDDASVFVHSDDARSGSDISDSDLDSDTTSDSDSESNSDSGSDSDSDGWTKQGTTTKKAKESKKTTKTSHRHKIKTHKAAAGVEVDGGKHKHRRGRKEYVMV